MESAFVPPPPFHFMNNLDNITSGNLSSSWTKWKNSFIIYSEACEFHTKDPKVQISILLHVIGEQCREVYEQFNETFKDTATLLKKFDSFFLPKKNLTIERHKFFTRSQSETESIEQYAFELKKIAASCEFKDLCDDLIKDRLICGIREVALRERLLREPELTLKKSLEICNLAQISRLQAVTIKQESTEHRAFAIDQQYGGSMRNTEEQGQAYWVSSGRGQRAPGRGAAAGWSRGARMRPRAPPPPPPPPRARWAGARPLHFQPDGHQRFNQRSYSDRPNESVKCHSCGISHDKDKCPAFGRQCFKCNNYNHYSRMCNVYEMCVEESPNEDREAA
ncbi:uncharacterized protein LOC119692073 [Plutella xylostella]|uniref:uncharacterized protein LOC119692073 n=1 Tax=Plutella xylostella TaxID=51655 RepID=UPI002032506B|nr:uncharacterized protein LOC119692073 [Plutella xylostella]